MKTILVTASGGDLDETVFATALAAGQPLAAHLEFYHLRLNLAEAAINTPGVVFARGAGLSDAMHTLTAQNAGRSEASMRHFRDFCTQTRVTPANWPHPSMGVTANWREEEGSLKELIVRARHHDLTVVGPHTNHDGLPQNFIERLLLNCGRPIIVAPKVAPHSLIGTIVIFWKGTAEAARAVTAASPLLAKANRVIVATAQEGADMSAEDGAELTRQLQWKGIHAQARHAPRDGRSVTERLSEITHDCEADLVVMGAYSHSVTRELLFGGCTRSFLDSAERAVFLVH